MKPFIPDAHTLFIVVHGTVTGIPAASDACFAANDKINLYIFLKIIVFQNLVLVPPLLSKHFRL